MDVEKAQGWASTGRSERVEEKNKVQVYKEEANLKWEPHPLNGRVELGYLLTKKEDGVKVTCLLARIPKGEGIPEHTHSVHDILYPLSGKGKIWIKGLGELALEKGVLVSVPPNTSHKVYDVTEDIKIYDVFSDAII